MSALIWDSTTQAFKDADTSRIYSGSSFGDAEGKVWNETAQAWEDAWSNKIILYDNGNTNIPVTGGLERWINNTSDGSVTFNSSNIVCENTSDYGGVQQLVNTVNKISLKGKLRFCFDVLRHDDTSNAYGIALIITNDKTKGYINMSNGARCNTTPTTWYYDTFINGTRTSYTKNVTDGLPANNSRGIVTIDLNDAPVSYNYLLNDSWYIAFGLTDTTHRTYTFYGAWIE